MPTKTQPGSIIASCKKYDMVREKEVCYSFAERNKIKLEQLYKWNTVLGVNGKNCGNMMWADYYYCVGV